MQERDPVAAGNLAGLGMIADHHSDFSLEFASPLTLQKVLKAMRQTRGEQRDLGNVLAEVDLKLHAEFIGQGSETPGDLIRRNLKSVQVKFETRQEGAGFHVGVLVRLQ